MRGLPKRCTIATAIGLALLPGLSLAQQATNEAGARTLDKVEVTGSRIKRTEIEGIDPVQMITAEDLEHQGFANVYDALSNITANTGVFVGEENTNNFNANAQALNLRGFGPGYTLVLLNGRRIPMLPKPAGTVSGNVTNLAMIPTSAVDRVEILTSGASAIYGSDAVAGVVNVILKDKVEGTTLSYRHGDTVHGGGRSERVSVTTGFEFGDTQVTAGLEWDRRWPIQGNQRRWFASPDRSPDPDYRDPTQVMSFWDRESGWDLLDISGRCDPLGYVPAKPGSATGTERYCGDNDFDSYTVRNGRKRLFGFLNATHALGEHELYATALSTRSRADAGMYRYGYAVDYEVVDDMQAAQPNAVAWRHAYRTFRNNEFPGSNQKFKENNDVIIAGIRGAVGRFDYSLNYNYGRYRYRDTVERFNDKAMMGLLFGEEGRDWSLPWAGSRWVRVGAGSLDANLMPNGNIDFFGQLSPEVFRDVMHTSVGDGRSTSQSFTADLSGNLFDLPAGPLAFAAVAEATRDSYRFITDQPTVDGDIYGWSGIRGSGKRNHYAVGTEFSVPLLAAGSGFGQWDAKLAARYDHYDDASDVGGAFTWQAGLSWRPSDWLLLRASHATSFRAPDMHVMFAERSSAYTSGVDYLSCVQQEGLQRGQSWQGCGDDYGTGSIRQYSEGDPGLHEEKGSSDTLGMVAQIGQNHSFTLDWYRIKLEEQVGLIGADAVLRYAAECALGFDAQGLNVDPNSPKCQTMLARVQRGGRNDSVLSVITSPFNTGMYQQNGIDASWSSTLPTDHWGRFSARISYTHILKTLSRYLPEDAVENIRDRQWNSEFRTRSNMTLGWDYKRFSSYLHFNRLGSSPVRWADSYERFRPWMTVNLSLAYRATEQLSFNLAVVNLFDKTPYRHASEKWWPYADITKYNPVGTEYFMTVEYKL